MRYIVFRRLASRGSLWSFLGVIDAGSRRQVVRAMASSMPTYEAAVFASRDEAWKFCVKCSPWSICKFRVDVAGNVLGCV